MNRARTISRHPPPSPTTPLTIHPIISHQVNLVVGAYRDDAGSPWVLPSVKLAEDAVVAACMNKEYNPIAGDAAYIDLARRFCLGDDCPALAASRVASIQSLSGTGPGCA